MDRGAWQATVHGAAESDTTEATFGVSRPALTPGRVLLCVLLSPSSLPC